MCLPEEYHSPLRPGQGPDLWGSCPLQGNHGELARPPTVQHPGTSGRHFFFQAEGVGGLTVVLRWSYDGPFCDLAGRRSSFVPSSLRTQKRSSFR